MSQAEPTDEQKAIIAQTSGPVRVLAGAGTGKTTTVTRRIAAQVRSGAFSADQILAVTFGRHAAQELRDRLAGESVLGVQAGTFHAVALRTLTASWETWRGAPIPRILPSKVPLVRGFEGIQDVQRLRDLAADIEWVKRHRGRPETCDQIIGESRYEASVPASTVARALAFYEERKHEQERLDYEDMMALCIQLFDEMPDVAAGFHKSHRAFTVDEYQDLDPLQYELLKTWVGDSDEVCVVGDGYQAIYGFKGSSTTYLDTFPTWQSGALTLPLTTNFRSTSEVLKPANALARFLSTPARLLVGVQNGPAHVAKGHPSETSETQELVRQIQHLGSLGVPYAEMAIMYRINSRSTRFELALSAEDIPYRILGDVEYLDRYHVQRGVAAALQAATSEEALAVVQALVEELRTSTGAVGQDETAVEADLLALLELIERYRLEVGDNPGDLSIWLDEQFKEEREGVQLMTLHKAKGLEFEAVFLPDLQEGSLPFFLARTPDELAEERRLFYVGLTRARRHLHISWVEGGRRTPSRFIREISTPTAKSPARPPRPVPAARSRATSASSARPRHVVIPPSSSRPPVGRFSEPHLRTSDDLAAITLRIFERGFTRGGAFSGKGWVHVRPAPELRCPTCAERLAIARQEDGAGEDGGATLAFLCGNCREVFDGSEIAPSDLDRFLKWDPRGDA